MNRRRFLINSSSALAAAYLLPACSPQARYRTDVVVLGAGFAGLMATRLLRSAGIETLLLEGNDRVGGRVFTLDSLPGRPEGGATELGKSYTELLGLCEALGIKTLPPSGRYPAGYALFVNGQLTSDSSWSASESDQFAANERDTPPNRLLRLYLPKDLPFANTADWGSRDWAEQDISLADYLRRQGASEAAIQVIDSNLNATDIETLSWADMLKGMVVRRNSQPRGLFDVEGGLSRVSDGLQSEVGDSLLLGRRINRIRTHSSGVEVGCDDGTRVQARLAICALPFSTLRKVSMDTDFSSAKKAAIQGMQYTPVTVVYARITKNFWEEDGLPEDTWTDTPIGRVFVSRTGGVPRIRAFSMGESSTILDEMIRSKKDPLEVLYKARPSTRGALEFETALRWGSDPMSLGAFSHYPAGGVSRYARAVASTEAGVAFAGEHTQVAAPGVEAALVSGRSAAQAVQHLLAAGKTA